MFIKLASLGVSSLVIGAYFINSDRGHTSHLTNMQSREKIQSSIRELEPQGKNTFLINEENFSHDSLLLTKSERENILSRKDKHRGNYMILSQTNQKNILGNPLYSLQLYADGQLQGAYKVVTGRTNTQNRNRHKSGTEAPLPNGIYAVARATVPGTIPEAGQRFLPIQPLFQTGRSALGIHYDPSFEKSNGEDGTSGCIALTNKEDLDTVLNFVRTYKPQFLEVNI